MFQVAQLTAAYGRHGQDRVGAIECPIGLVVMLADGAGGTSGGAEAAETFSLWAKAYATRTPDVRGGAQWATLLEQVDRQIAAVNGQTTGVIVAVSADGFSGASVGDSAAWIVGDDGFDNLTSGQAHKPLLGSGASKPIAFERSVTGGTLLVASDGLVKYAPPARICELARLPDLNEAARRLVDLVRLRSGALQDDVGIVLVRTTNTASASRGRERRKRYTLTDDGEMLEADAD
jgi:serine/threonine protein phosphatase PrpC